MKCFVMTIRAAVNFYYQFLKTSFPTLQQNKIVLQGEILSFYASPCYCRSKQEATERIINTLSVVTYVVAGVHQETRKKTAHRSHIWHVRRRTVLHSDCLRISVATADASVINEIFPGRDFVFTD